MDLTIVYFTLTLLLFQAVNSENSESEMARVSNALKISLLEMEEEELEYSNTSTLSRFNNLVETRVQKAEQELTFVKLEFGIQIMKKMHEIRNLYSNMIRIDSKIITDIARVFNSMRRLWDKENKRFNGKGRDIENPIHIDDLYHLQISEWCVYEYAVFLNSIQALKPKIYEWSTSASYELHWENFRKLARKFAENNEDMLETLQNDENDEEKPPKFENDAGADELERLQRLALLIQDQLNEMPKPKNEDQNNAVEFESEVPRWLFTEVDIEDIRSRYSSTMEKLKNDENPKTAAVKKILEKNEFTVNYFCKTMAEYLIVSNIYMECASEDDTECEDIMEKALLEKRFRKFKAIFDELKAQKLLPL